MSTTSVVSTNCSARATQLTVGVEHERRAVEHELVLAADLIDVHQRTRRVGGAGRQHPLTLRQPIDVVGRRVQVDDQLGAACGLLADRAERTPCVLADGHADLDAGDLEQHEGLRAGCEVALLVEDA